MPTVSAGLIEVTIRCEFNNTEADNVFHFWNGTNAPVPDLDAFLTAFDAFIIPEFSDLVSSSTDIALLTARDVFGLLPDAVLTPSIAVGTQPADVVNNFTTARINLNVSSKETRRGYKRIGGMSEQNITGNELSVNYRNFCQAFGTKLEGTMIVGAETYQLYIYGRPTPSLPGRHVVNRVTSTSVPNRQFTQGSRKR